VWAGAAIGGNHGHPDSAHTLGPRPDAVLRALGGGVVLGPPAAEADRTPTPTPTVQPDVPEHTEALAAESAIAVYVTFYTCPPYCGDPSGSLPLDEGQAACDWAYMGRRFMLNGAEWVCNDTGGAVYGAHVDLFFRQEADGWAYLATHGTNGVLTWLDRP